MIPCIRYTNDRRRTNGVIVDASPDLDALWHRLLPEQQDVLRQITTYTAQHGGAAYLVGGPVRDLLLGAVKINDIDVMTTVDARTVAKMFPKTAFKQETVFGTATILIDVDTTARARGSVDLATARTETYAHPGALPVAYFPVAAEDDLRRRDFTINAMALSLVPDGFGALLDPYGGLHDLQTGIVRVLHEQSFADDPTRLFRAIRYATRYGFALPLETEQLFADAMKANAIQTISLKRRAHEIELALTEPNPTEPNPVACLAAFDERGLLSAVSPVLTWDYWIASRIVALVGSDVSLFGDVMYALFVCRQDETAMSRLFADIPLSNPQHDRIKALVALYHAQAAITPETPLSALAPLLQHGKVAERTVSAFVDEPARWRIADYFARKNELGIRKALGDWIGGAYLQAIGLAPGKIFREILGALDDARLNGFVNSAKEEKLWVQQYLREHGISPGSAGETVGVSNGL